MNTVLSPSCSYPSALALSTSLPGCRLALLLLACLAAPLSAAPPPVPGGAAFPTALTGTPGTLLHRVANQGRVVVVAYHNGELFTAQITGTDTRRWVFANPTDPTSLTQMPLSGDPRITDNGSHGYMKLGDYIAGFASTPIKRVDYRVNSSTSPGYPDYYTLDFQNALQTGMTPGDGVHRNYFPWSVTFSWIQYGAVTGNGYVFRGNTKIAEWPSLQRDGVIGNAILLGNLLFMTSDESNLGIAAYDLTPSLETGAPPVLLDKLEGTIGAYIAAPYANYIVFGQRSATMDIVDISDPTNLRFVKSINLSGNGALNGGDDMGYFQFQDNYGFGMRHKVDMDTLEPVLELDEVGNNRPSGSAAGPLDTSQFLLPVGNLLFTAPYSSQGRDALGVWLHSATPDTKAPFVAYHIPRPNAVNYPLNAPISLLIHETLESYTIINGDTLLVRPLVGGQPGAPIDCITTLSYNQVLTITPVSPLQDNTTYQVDVVAGGIKDAAGNGIEGYSFTFSTGSAASGNQAPNISNLTLTPSPAALNQSITVSASASDPEGDPLQYRFTFGNGSIRDWASSASATVSYSQVGHYPVKVQVRDLRSGVPGAVVSRAATATAAPVITETSPTRSSPIALNPTTRRVWSVNPDSDSISVINADSKAFVAEYALESILGLSTSVDPRSVAIDGGGHVWIACRDADRVVVLNSSGALVQAINTGYGSAPVGVAVSPDGSAAFVTLEGGTAASQGQGQLVRYRTSDRVETGRLTLGPTPRAIAITGNGARVLVTRFISGAWGEIWDVDAAAMTLTRTFKLVADQSGDTAANGRGVPTYVSGITISPNGNWAYYTAVKANVDRGDFFHLSSSDNGSSTPDSTVRSIVGCINLVNNSEPDVNQYNNDPTGRIDIDNSDSPTSVVFSPRNDWFFVTLQGNNMVAIFDDLAVRAGPRNQPAKNSKGRFAVGLAPQGAVLDPLTNRLFVMDFMGRSVSVLEFGPFFNSGDRETQRLAISATTRDKLSPTVKLGKQIFYQAQDGSGLSSLPTLSFEGYISCATCHLDGSHDGRTWDFTQRGEGFRNTTDLRGRAGMAHGNVHWSGNFNEIQDFVLDVVNEFGGGEGLLPAGQSPHPSLGTSNAGRDPDLDALAAYVASLNAATLPKSPYRNPDGTRTLAAQEGEAVFSSQGCAACHSLPHFTDSAVGSGNLHNVGTLRTSSGQRLGATLTGIDTPTLLGLWDTAPYFHDGSAFTLDEVFQVAGGTLYQAESAALVGATIAGALDVRINHANRSHGLFVNLSSGQSVTFSAVNGGAGGAGDIEVRYKTFANPSGQTITLTVNGTPFNQPMSQAGSLGGGALLFTRARFESVPLNAGANNSIVLTVSTDINLDEILVSTADFRAAANPHRKVLNLSATDRTNLKAFLLQLDGSSVPGGGGGTTTSGATGGSSSGGTTTGGPSLTVSTTTAAPSAPITTTVANGPGTIGDWVGLFPQGAPHSGYLDWVYLNGLQSFPSSPLTAATLSFTLPATPGTYEFRLFRDNGEELLATSPTVTVTAGGTTTGGSTTAATTTGGSTSGAQSPFGGSPHPVPGTIQAENFDLGGANVAYSDSDASNNGNQYRTAEAVDIEVSTDAGAGHNVGWTGSGEWLEYTVSVTSAGLYDISLRTARQPAGPAFMRILVDGADVTGSITVPSTGGWQTWTNVVKTSVNLTAGQKVVRVEFVSSGINFNHMTFTKIASPYGGALAPIPGTIQAENFDLGGQGVAYSDSDAANNGNQYRTAEAVDIEATSDSGGGFNVGWTTADEWLTYSVNIQTAGTYNIAFRAAREPSGPATLRLLVDSIDVTGLVSVPSTGGWQSWTNIVSSGIALTPGQKLLRLEIPGGGFNLNHIQFNLLNAPQITQQPASTSLGATQNATFTVAASGSDLSYQWRRNGVNISGATSASYTLANAQLSDNGAQFTVIVSNSGGSVTSQTATLTVSHSVKVNFQLATTVTPSGYLPDSGQIFANRGNGHSYGWAVDQTHVARERAVHSDKRLDTLNHFQHHQLGGAGVWEIAVPNGSYQVTLAAGDPSYTTSINNLVLEGAALTDPDGVDALDIFTATVTVSDGRLTVTAGTGAVESKISYIDIVSTP